MTDQSKNFLTSNNSLLERLQDDDLVYGYNYNRIVDALTGNYIGYTYIAHNDTWVNSENVDPNFPARLNYVVPKNAVQVLQAVLSFKLLSYRTYNSFSLTTTGTESGGHTHASAAHVHKMWDFSAGSPGATNLTLAVADGSGNQFGVTAAGTGTGSDNTASTTPGSTGGVSGNHTHTVSGSSLLGITEGTTATGVTIQFDGSDQTVSLGGPWSTDIVEMDVTKFLPQLQGVWHTINLTSTQLGQIQTHLRLTVLVSSPK